MARVTGLEPAASGVTGQRSNQLSYTRLCFNKARLLARSFYNVNGFYALMQFYFKRCYPL